MKILIVGASVAGLEAAFYARKRYPSATIQLLDQSQVLGYHPTRFNRYLIGEFETLEGEDHALQEKLANQNITCLLNCRALKILPADKSLQIFYQGRVQSLTYDAMILATGSQDNQRLVQDFEEDSSLIKIRSLEESRQSLELLKQSDQVLVVGAGQIGLEASQVYHRVGKQVTLLEASEYLNFKYLDHPMSERIQRRLEQAGIRIVTGATVNRMSFHPSFCQIETSKATYQTKAVQLATNFVPNSAWLKDQVTCYPDGTVQVDDYLQTSVPQVFAIGDLIRVPFGPYREKIYLPLVHHAKNSAKIAVENLFYQQLKRPISQRIIVSYLFDQTLLCGGLTEEEMRLTGRRIFVSYQEDGEDFIQILSDFYTGQVLGVQALSCRDISRSVAYLEEILVCQKTDQALALESAFYRNGESVEQERDWLDFESHYLKRLAARNEACDASQSAF